MQNLSSPASTLTDLEIFLTFFQENFRVFQKSSKANFKKTKLRVCFMLHLAKHVHAKFQLSSFYPGGLRQIFDHFSGKFQNFHEKISKHFNSEIKIQIGHPRRHLLPKFQSSSIFTKISKAIL
jgi:hypothetical protein